MEGPAPKKSEKATGPPVTTSAEEPYLSLVIPFYNEEESVENVCAEVVGTLAGQNGLGWELILVDDGSVDGTGRIIDQLAAGNEKVQSLHLRPNSGQSAALITGFRAARGKFIATLDGDGQNDPRDIPVILKEIEKSGTDMVCGVRQKRLDNLVRRISSRIANGVRSAVLKDGIVDVGCSMRIFRRECLQQINFFRNAHRFFPALFKMAGFSVSEIPVNHRPRRLGTSKYGGGINSRLWVGIADLLGVYWLRKRSFAFKVFKKNDD